MFRCWMCDKDIKTEELISHCPDCGTELDFTPYTPIKEEDMPFEKQESSNETMWLGLPKEGESYDYTQHGKITAIVKVDNPEHKKGKFNFVKKINEVTATGKQVKVDEDCGYYYRIEFSDGSKISVSSWSPFYAMQEANIMEGYSMKIDHPNKGEWIVERVAVE